MKIVIDIPEESYNAICTITTLAEMESVGQDTKRVIYTSIQNGNILPKGHGRLIDADELDIKTITIVLKDDIENAPTIIEADKAESEDKE